MTDLRKVQVKPMIYNGFLTVMLYCSTLHRDAFELAEQFLIATNCHYIECSDKHELRWNTPFPDEQERSNFIEEWKRAVKASTQLNGNDVLASNPKVNGDCGIGIEMQFEFNRLGRLMVVAKYPQIGESWKYSVDLETAVDNLSPEALQYFRDILNKKT